MERMGRPPKYTKEQAKKERNKQHNIYRRQKYDHLQANVPKGMNQRIREACNLENTSKDSYVVSALEARLEKTEKLNPQ